MNQNYPPSHPTILVIDDKPANLEVLYETLCDEGYEVLVEIDGLNAITQIKNDPPDLILLDVLMPEINGFDLCQKLKEDPQTQDIPIIFMTALSQTSDKVKAFNLGAVDYLTKPFQQQEVLARVKTHLKISHLSKSLEAQNRQLIAEIDRRKKAELALENLISRLDEKVKERTSALYHTEELWRLTLENAPIGIITLNLEGDFLTVNQAFCKMLGYQSDQLLTKSLLDFSPLDQQELIKNSLEKIVNYEIDNVEIEQIFLNQNGNSVLTITRIAIIKDKDNKPLQLVAEVEDITQRKENEATLKLQERAMSASNNGIVIADTKQKDNPIIYVNPAFEQITGYNQKEIIGQNCRFLQGKEHNQEGLNQLREALQKGKGCQVILRNYRKDGSLFWNELSISPIYNENHQLTHYIGIQSDITDRKQAEEEIKNSLKEKELLLKEIHHRVKNNLLVVTSILELQKEYIKDEQMIDIFQQSQDRIYSMALIHEKLYQSTNLDKINFGDYLESLLNTLLLSYNYNTDLIKIEYQIQSFPLNIETAIPCALIFNELICNSFKHGFPNGKTGQIKVTLSQDEGKIITLIIEDNGIGFPEGMDLRKTDSLGLELVFTLTEQLEGTIEIEGKQGTKFTLKFAELQYEKRF